jgi:hypothetical protein
LEVVLQLSSTTEQREELRHVIDPRDLQDNLGSQAFQESQEVQVWAKREIEVPEVVEVQGDQWEIQEIRDLKDQMVPACLVLQAQP